MFDETDIPWEPCPPGSIGQMVSSIKIRHRRRQAARMSLVSVAVLGVGFVVWFIGTRPIEYDYGGIVCSEVRRLAPGYLNGELDEDMSNKIAVHLGLCPTCGPTMQEMEESTHVSGTSCSDPGCEHCIEGAFVVSAKDVQTIVIDGHF